MERNLRSGSLVFVFLLIFPLLSVPQSSTFESDPSVVEILPKNYPLSRVRVTAEKYPWSAAGLLTALGGRVRCTGTLISDRHVLTAAHCVFGVRDFPSEMNFLAGYEQDRYVAHSKAKRIYISESFEPDKPSLAVFANDWALIELEKPIGKTAGYLGWAYFDVGVFEKTKRSSEDFKVTGYRGDRRYVQTVDHKCRITGFALQNKLIVHQCPIRGGDSGGPILFPYRDRLLVVGVDVGVRGKPDLFLKRGDKRTGYAVPSATFRRQLERLGIHSGPLNEAIGLVGRFGKPPS